MVPELNNKISALGLKMPKIAIPVGSYEAVLIVDRFVYVSGQLAFREDRSVITGLVGKDLTLDDGVFAAERCGLGLISLMSKVIEEKGLIFDCMIAIQGFVACEMNFTQHPKIINGSSNLLLSVLGDQGKHSRIAVGVSSLPLGSAVEVSAIAKVK